jgi:hypothetical protein
MSMMPIMVQGAVYTPRKAIHHPVTRKRVVAHELNKICPLNPNSKLLFLQLACSCKGGEAGAQKKHGGWFGGGC